MAADQKQPTDPVIKETILARLEVLPSNLHLASGGQASSISRDEMIKHVSQEDSIGLDFIQVEVEFLRAIKEGLVQKIANTDPTSQ